MGEIIRFRGITKLDLDPDLILDELKGKIENFVVLGYDKEGNFFFSSTIADGGDILWLIEILKKRMVVDD